MSKQLDSFDEVGWCADNGNHLLTRQMAEVAISVTRDHDAKVYVATIRVFSARTDMTICETTRPFSTIESLMELLGIDDNDDMWEVLD